MTWKTKKSPVAAGDFNLVFIFVLFNEFDYKIYNQT